MALRSPFLSRRGFMQVAGGATLMGLSGLGRDYASAQTTAGLLRLGFAGGGSTERFDPHAPVGLAVGALSQSIFEQITQVGPDFLLNRSLAEEITPNATLDQWDVRLPAGVEFHNGKTLTAEDLMFTVRRILDPKSPGYAAGQLAFVDLDNMTALDERTVRFKLKAPFAFFELAFGDGGVMGVVPTDFSLDNLVGTGPYKIKSITPGQQIELVRHENYWGDRPILDEVVALNFKDDFARVNALIGGQIDAMNQLPLSMLKMLEGREDVSTLLSDTGLFNPFSMRVDEGPFADNRVRQAFRLMVDRDEAVAQAFGGNASVCNDLYSPMDPDYNGSLMRSHDPEKAKALLKEAGAEGMECTLVVAPVRFGMVEAAQVIANQASKIGVTVNIKKLEAAASRSPEVLDSPFSFGLFPGLSYHTMCAISDGPYSTLNSTRFADDEFKSLFDQVSAEPDAGNRHGIMQRMQEIQFDKGGYLLPAFPKAADAFSDRVKGVVPDASGLGLGRCRFGVLSLA
ncbi:MAG: ABC transporter substrate-binding protein [Rhodobacteraceae bacterium]|nr:ABC transporter substrate-binding protein [Paracoccaceae bacterium]